MRDIHRITVYWNTLRASRMDQESKWIQPSLSFFVFFAIARRPNVRWSNPVRKIIQVWSDKHIRIKIKWNKAFSNDICGKIYSVRIQLIIMVNCFRPTSTLVWPVIQKKFLKKIIDWKNFQTTLTVILSKVLEKYVLGIILYHPKQGYRSLLSLQNPDAH
jgi:hypothetical protein